MPACSIEAALMRSRLLVLFLSLGLLGGCGGDEGEIEEVVTTFFTSDDPQEVCPLMTDTLAQALFPPPEESSEQLELEEELDEAEPGAEPSEPPESLSGIEDCLDEEGPVAPYEEVEVEDMTVSEDGSIARATVVSPAEGESAPVGLIKTDDGWKLDSIEEVGGGSADFDE